MALRDIGLGIVDRAPALAGLARWVYRRLPQALHETPTTRLGEMFAGQSPVTFLQIGAFDGVAGDPVRPLVLTDARWRGALIEPQPAVFQRLTKNYEGCPAGLRFFQCAVSDTAGSLPIYHVSEAEAQRLALPEWAAEVASFDRNHVAKHFPDAEVTSTTVPVRTVADICAECGFDQVDAVVMDVEGHEIPIIKSIDWLGLKIRACVFEHKHMSEADVAFLDAFFGERGFAIARFGRDTLAHKA